MTKSASTRTRKNAKTAAAGQLNMAVAADIELGTNDGAILEQLLGEMGADIGDIHEDPLEALGATDEANAVIESVMESASAPMTAALDDADAIEAAVLDLERQEANHAVYDGEVHAAAASDADTPSTDPEATPAADKKAKAPKEPKAPRTTYVNGKPSDVLKARLGEKVGEALILEASDAALDAEALKAKQEDLLKLLNARPHTSEGGSTQKKVAEKIVQLFGWINKGGSLNEVMARTFKVLARDGEIVSGDKGNLHAELLAKPYSVGTARAQAGQMMAMLPMLKIANKADKGKLVANDDSLILMKVKAELGLS